MTALSLETIYRNAFGKAIDPNPLQRAIAERADLDVVVAPTASGKTAAITLGWAWRRLTRTGSTPRRLVWCLPMRALVEQTRGVADEWMKGLCADFERAGLRSPGVYAVMGGGVEDGWRLEPDHSAIIVGTQDMLLSRALMRGYGMSRFGWPIDFGLLHSDALWVFDEAQLMGAALATSAQLEAFRRCEGWRREGLARSLWASATLDPAWLRTAEFRREIPAPRTLRYDKDIRPEDEPAALTARLDAVKRLARAKTILAEKDAKDPADYARRLAAEVAGVHRPGATSLVILNTVARAQAVYRALGGAGEFAEQPKRAKKNNDALPLLGVETGLLLLHSRFRPPDRRRLEEALLAEPASGRIVIATQAVEAGVDMTSAVMFTELAPWSSLAQRFGRCNRKGEFNYCGGAEIRWIDVETDAGAPSRPYEAGELRNAREILETLAEASPRALMRIPPSAPPMSRQVVRPKDFEELFDTDADLSGYDLDISPYIRDGDDMTVSLFWRSVGNVDSVATPRPERDELCPAPLGEVKAWLTKTKDGPLPAYVENPLEKAGKNWLRFDPAEARLRPGMTILLDVSMGGYDPEQGFVGAASRAAALVVPIASKEPETDANTGETMSGEPQSHDYPAAVTLAAHSAHVLGEAQDMAAALDLSSDLACVLERAADWHDAGKAYAPFQKALGASETGPPLAKSVECEKPADNEGKERRRERPRDLRRYFRHELASALAFLAQHDGEANADLIAFLIAAHHGKVRMGLRALPDERPTGDADPPPRIARGVQDGDALPETRLGRETSAALTLDLGLMEMGEDKDGRRSWAARTQALLAEHGPFRLAFLEALLRMADWRASAKERERR